VISVHTVVSFDFASSLVMGWHTTIFPPYFVAGAIFSGFAMVLTLMIPVRKIYHLEDIVTERHLDLMAKITLTTGLIVGYGYLMEMFIAWYSGNRFEQYFAQNATTGPYGIFYWMLILCNVVAVQILWFPNIRRNPLVLFVLSIIINIGMWLERFVIVVVGLHRDYMPSAWAMYYPTLWDWATFLGSIGLFFVALLIFIRVLPMVASFEVKELLSAKEEK
jgi:Ni/Fe-hydrogenase subunit HybB-like protein